MLYKLQNTFSHNSKHVLYIWHLWKNVIKNLNSTLVQKLFMNAQKNMRLRVLLLNSNNLKKIFQILGHI